MVSIVNPSVAQEILVVNSIVGQLTDLMVNPFVGQLNTTTVNSFVSPNFGSYEPYGETREIQWSEFHGMATKDIKS